MKKMYISLALALIFVVLFIVYFKEGSLPVNSNNTEATTFTIQRGQNVNEVINNLSHEKLIRNRIVFLLIVKQLGIENKIQAGGFRLSQSMNAHEIAKALTKGTNDVWVTIIEGIRKEEVAQIIGEEINIPQSAFVEQAKEGYLFPDTYLISRQATMEEILGMFKANFDRKYTDEIAQKAAAKNLTQLQVLTIASLVEREANSKDAKNNVASIIYKRYLKGWPLEIDATVQYALGYQNNENDWWKENLSYADLQLDSAYNTYAQPGLPPGPIASPGLDAIEAVVNANGATPYWFYISDKNGENMHYAKTLEEHNSNIQKYLR